MRFDAFREARITNTIENEAQTSQGLDVRSWASLEVSRETKRQDFARRAVLVEARSIDQGIASSLLKLRKGKTVAEPDS